jgi:hypothetical protein
MGLLSAIGSFAGSFKLNDLVGSMFGNSLDFLGPNLGSFATNILSGSITNAAVAALSGGDIGKAALFGAAGGGLSGSGLGFGKELGGAVQGYGLDKAMGGSGLMGAAAGGIGGYMNKAASTSPAPGTSVNTAQNGASTPAGATGLPNQAPATGGSISEKLRSMGLVDKDGDGTLLGKALVSGIGGYAQAKSTESLMDKELDNRKELDRNQAELDHEQEQKRIAAFTGRQPNFRVVRNG